MIAPRALSWLRECPRMGPGTYWGNGYRNALNGLYAIGDLLFPPVCTFCGADMVAEAGRAMLCCACLASLLPDRETCRRCANPLPDHWSEADACPRCRGRQYFFHQANALGEYRADMRQAVRRMKRPAFEPLTHAMGLLLAERVRVWLVPSGDVDFVVPVPMHWSRRLTRGTNTASILGAAVGRSLGRPIDRRILRCRRKTRKQGTLRPSDRVRNVRDAFRVSSAYDITGAHVLIIDDIMTTGATVSEAARAMRHAGARLVSVAVVARGTGA